MHQNAQKCSLCIDAFLVHNFMKSIVIFMHITCAARIHRCQTVHIDDHAAFLSILMRILVCIGVHGGTSGGRGALQTSISSSSAPMQPPVCSI